MEKSLIIILMLSLVSCGKSNEQNKDINQSHSEKIDKFITANTQRIHLTQKELNVSMPDLEQIYIEAFGEINLEISKKTTISKSIKVLSSSIRCVFENFKINETGLIKINNSNFKKYFLILYNGNELDISSNNTIILNDKNKEKNLLSIQLRPQYKQRLILGNRVTENCPKNSYELFNIQKFSQQDSIQYIDLKIELHKEVITQ